MPYLVEAGNLFENGASLANLDEAMLDFGMPMGPMRLLDEVGVDVALHVAQTLAAGFSDRMKVPAILGKMAEAGLLGRKNGRGFYLHGKTAEPQPNPQTAAFVQSRTAAALSREEIQERMVFLMINEAARCLEEQIVAEPADVDFAMILGTGFAPFRGGPLRYADSVGAGKTRRRDGTAGRLRRDAIQAVRLAAQIGGGRKEILFQRVKIYDCLEITAHRAAGKTRSDESAPVMDTSKMSAGQRAALELTEAAREAAGERTFAAGLFMGEFNLAGIHPFPKQSADDRERGDTFLEKLEKLLREKVDPDEIDRTGEIPQPVIDELARLGAFGIKIPVEYGGLGLSQTNYCRAAMLLGSWCGNTTALISAHQSIGVPQPLILFGTEAQKKKYLPRVARGEISAFALTEVDVGSDPAAMATHAEPAPDGDFFILNGEKLWCTNGTKAGVIVVMARTPPKIVNGKSKEQITAFIVETNWPGVEVIHRCRFMGLRALYNGVIRFTNVRVPRENILLAEGKGLRVALTTLDTGRLTLPAACVGLSKRCLEISRDWANRRVQWGAPIGKHAAIADKIARMAANTFAMEAMTLLAASRVDRDKNADVRLEAALCKLWGTEAAWQIVNDTMQIRGGRGYETAASLKARGEAPIPVERFLRDSRINTIFEGSSEIMRLFIARELLDPHLKIAAPVLNSQLPWSQRLRAAAKAAMFYLAWYPKQWLPVSPKSQSCKVQSWQQHLRYAARTSRRLARAIFHAMLRHGPKLEREQLLLGRFVDIGADLFAMAATCLRAQSLPGGSRDEEMFHLVDFFCRTARLRIEDKFQRIGKNADRAGYKLAQEVLAEKHRAMEKEIV